MSNCKPAEIDFIVKDTDPEMAAVEDDIVANLKEIGIKVNTRFHNDTEYRDAEVNGDYHLLFARTWGAPYDPHSYMASWAVPAHVEYTAIGNLQVSLLSDGSSGFSLSLDARADDMWFRENNLFNYP